MLDSLVFSYIKRSANLEHNLVTMSQTQDTILNNTASGNSNAANKRDYNVACVNLFK